MNWIHGDGLQLIYLTPLATRPNHYYARIDSKINLDNWSDSEALRFCDAVLDDLYDEIEGQYGRRYEEWEHDNGRTYSRVNPFPALECDTGCAWGLEGFLTAPDVRTDADFRRILKQNRAAHTP